MTNLPDGFVSDGSSADASEVALLAEMVGGALPEDYSQFITSIGGGRFSDRDIVVFASPWGVQDTVLSSLFGTVSAAQETERLRGWDHIPERVAVIGEDPAGNYFIVSADPDSPGVFFWDHERVNPEQARTTSIGDFENTMCHIAESFTEFLNNLVTPDQADQRRTLLQTQPLPPMPEPAPEIEYEQAPTAYNPGPLRGPADAIQVYRPSFTYKIEHGAPPPTDFLRPLALGETMAPYANAEPLLAAWDPPMLNWIRDDNTTDFPFAGSYIAVRYEAGETLRTTFERYGELLPVNTETGPLWIFRCLNIVDALDPNTRYREGYNGYHDILDYNFVPEKVKDAGIFTIPKQTWQARVFFTRPLAEELLNANVRCPPFNHIWTANQ